MLLGCSVVSKCCEVVLSVSVMLTESATVLVATCSVVASVATFSVDELNSKVVVSGVVPAVLISTELWLVADSVGCCESIVVS